MHVAIIKTHGHVSAAKKDMQHTSVLFTGTDKSLFSTPHISITTWPICTFTLHIHCLTYKFEENRLMSLACIYVTDTYIHRELM